MKNTLPLLFLCFSLSFVQSQNIPINFETPGNGADWMWTVFENDTNPALEFIPNPDPTGLNPSSTVAKFTALETGMPFAGCESLHGGGIGTFTITPANAIIRILVWKSEISDVGIKLVRVDNWSLGEIKIPNTKVNEWEQIEFDFSSHMGNTYDQIVIFPDFNARAQDNVIYFDEVYGGVATPMSTEDPLALYIEMAPNPVHDLLQIKSQNVIEQLSIYSIAGEEVFHQDVLRKEASLQLAHLPKGVYILRGVSGGKIVTQKLIKN